MGAVLLTVFTLIEIGLVVLTMTKQKEKGQWLKNRVVFRAAEAVIILLVMILPGIGNKFRFTFAGIILGLRLLIAAGMWLIKRKTAEGEKKAAGLIFTGFLAILLIGASLAPAFIFTGYQGLPASGEYAVKQTEVILVDKSRMDAFENDGSCREVPAHFYYPDVDGAEGSSFPLILFSHGAFGYYQSNSSTYLELASNGYVVISLDHPHHAFFTKDTSGNIVIVDMNVMQGAIDATNGVLPEEEAYRATHEWLDLRVADQNFVLDTLENAKTMATNTETTNTGTIHALDDSWYLGEASESEILKILSMMDTEQIGLMGHSLGGATSVEVGRERDDIDAVVDIDGTMFGEEIDYQDGQVVYEEEPYPVPVLEFSNERGHNELMELKEGERYANAEMMGRALDSRYVWIRGTEHMDFTDLPMFSPMLGSMFGSGERDTEECMNITNSLILQFYDYYLKGKGELDFQEVY